MLISTFLPTETRSKESKHPPTTSKPDADHKFCQHFKDLAAKVWPHLGSLIPLLRSRVNTCRSSRKSAVPPSIGFTRRLVLGVIAIHESGDDKQNETVDSTDSTGNGVLADGLCCPECFFGRSQGHGRLVRWTSAARQQEKLEPVPLGRTCLS